MDAVFAILVLGAVIFFGALISAGNERQRKALEGIREQASQWAMQDLRLKREKFAREVKVEDPVSWLNQVVTNIFGEELGLIVSEVFDNPKAIVCTTKDGKKIVFTPISSNEIHRLKTRQFGKLNRFGNAHPLYKLTTNNCFELSILNSGIFFDAEFPLVWKKITGFDLPVGSRIWLYFF